MKRMGAKAGDLLGWTKQPPAKEHRERWANAICDCLASGDERFRKILADHVNDGTIVSARATALLVQEADESAA